MDLSLLFCLVGGSCLVPVLANLSPPFCWRSVVVRLFVLLWISCGVLVSLSCCLIVLLGSLFSGFQVLGACYRG